MRIFFFVRLLRDKVLELILLNLGCGASTGGDGGDKHDLATNPLSMSPRGDCWNNKFK